MNVRVCDAGGPIKAGQNLYHIGRCLSTLKSCDCDIIAMQDEDFLDWPLAVMPVFVIHSTCDPAAESLTLYIPDPDT